MPEPDPQSLSDVVRQISAALKDGFDRALEEHRAGYTDPHEVGELRKTIERLSAQLMDQQSVNRQLASTVKDKDDEIESYRRECERLADQFGRMPDQLRIAQQTCQDLTRVIPSITEQRDNAIEQARELKGQLESRATMLAIANERNEETDKELHKARAEVERLKGQLKSSVDAHSNRGLAEEGLRRQLRDHEDEVCRQDREIEELNRTVATLKTNNSEAARNLSVAYERIEVLERDLHHEKTVADRCNDFLQAKDTEISELKTFARTLGKDLEARKRGGEPRIDVFDKLENLRNRTESLEQRMLDMESHTHGGAPTGATTGFPKVDRG